MKKKILLAAVGAMSVFALAACSSKGNEEIASMKGSKITVADFYEEAKNESANQNLVRNMIIYKAFDDKYGDKVSDKAVDKEYNKQKDSMGDAFEQQLEAAGYTTKTFKEYLRQNLVLEAGLKANIKLTDADKKAAWESFHPEVEAQIIALASEDEAKDVLEKAKEKDADFAKLAKENSTDTATSEDGGTIKFDSQSTTPPAEVKTAAFELKDGEVSDVITATDATTYQTSYYVVKMVKNKDKGNDMEPYKDEIKEIAEQTKLSDSAFTSKIIGQTLKDANVKIKDDSFKDILSSYIDAADTSSSTAESTEESSAASSTADSSAAESTTESSTADSE
ncbi:MULTISPECIES: peptidylprolyl isomerase [Enterococcus]|uniref:peptidylprolyl isomerase n=1 Tax=Enterococcus TaxID=1350 RepID=UPI00065E9BD5|nr:MULTISPECIES: peptidylprolyl isomerase [Enterococcus]KAF1303372.1 peptidylprolyl isomerase [Enterococcus sp. JM9B]